MKLARPIIPPQLEEGSLKTLLDGDLEAQKLEDIDATKVEVVAGSWDGVIIERASFLQAQLPRLAMKDCVIKQSDFSSTVLSDGAANRVEYSNCRMMGVDISKMQLHDVTFRGCKLDMANLRFADIRRVKFIDCTLVETDFLGATLHDITFESCRLERTVFDRAHCKNVDLRGAELIEISGWGSLKGAWIDDVQLMVVAPYLANELGLTIKS